MKKKKMTIYIFGAGASKASQIGVNKPKLISPLVNDLFEDQYTPYAKEVNVEVSDLNHYKTDFRKAGLTLEEWLTKWWLDTQNLDPQFLRGERADFGKILYYFWRLFSKISTTYDKNNLYRIFLQKVKKTRQPFGLISFNYDLLLDKAVKEIMGINLINDLRSYTTANTKYIKVHGSVNWLIPARFSDPKPLVEHYQDGATNIRYELAINSIFNGDMLSLKNLFVVDPNSSDLQDLNFIGNHVFDGKYFYPLMFMPLTIKQYELIEKFNESIVSEAKSLIKQADEIFLIGYRATDDIAHDILKEARKGTRLSVVGLSSSYQIQQKLLNKHKNLTLGFAVNNGFAKFIETYWH